MKQKKNHTKTHNTFPVVFFLSILFVFFFTTKVYADTVTGNGYVIEQTITPIEGSVSGNGYTAIQSAQGVGDQESGVGYSLWSVLGPSYTPPVVPPPSGGGGGGGGGGYFVYPPIIVPPTSSSTATSSPPINSNTILTTNGSTCSSRITISQPVDFGLATNKKEDVQKIETFLNTYEKEKLKVNGLYEEVDVLAVKRWQEKYRSLILNPMKLRNPTGTVYTLSMRQIERQSSASCGQSIIVHACPYFKTYTKVGDKGEEVKKIQQFLNIVQGEKVPITGVYGPVTVAAAKRFQKSYRKGIISIVTLGFVSGNWNVSTRTKANEVIGCDTLK